MSKTLFIIGVVALLLLIVLAITDTSKTYDDDQRD